MSFYFDIDPLNGEATPGKGIIGAERVIVGIAPSPNRPRDLINEPFGAKSYALIKAISKHFPSLYITNFQKTPLTPGKKIPAKQQKKWAPLLYHELGVVVQPGVTRILTLGTEPSKLLCPGFTDMRSDHGTVFYNPQLEVEVIPSYHFAAAMRSAQLKPILKRDLQRFFEGEFEDAQAFELKAPPPFKTDLVFLDIETSGLELFEDEIISIGVSPSTESPVYIAEKPQLKTLEKIFNMVKDKIVVGHNIAFDLAFLELNSNLPWTHLKVQDTMLAAYVLGESILSLKHLVTANTNRRGSHSGGGFEDPQYLAEDVAGTRAIHHVFSKRANQQWITKLLYDLSPRISRMRLNGVHIDWNLAEKLKKDYKKKAAIAADALSKTVNKFRKANAPPINWNSNDQVAQVLIKAGVPLTETTPTGKFSTAEPVLLKFKEKYPIIGQYFAHKDILHELSFIESYEELRGTDYLLHPKFNLMGAATGRSSMSDPNLQQVPRLGPLKLLFTSRHIGGYFGLIDLAQAELRVVALLADDDLLAQALMEDDIHRINAAIVYKLPREEVTAFQRKKSKGVTFGLLYGGSPQGLAERVGVEVAEVEVIVRTLMRTYPKLKQYLDEQKELAVATGQSTTPLGRIRDLSVELAEEGAGRVERQGVNSPVQGTASDIMMIVLNSCFQQQEQLQLQSLPIFGVHDSSMHDIHPDELKVYTGVVREAFRSLNDTPLNQFPLWGHLPIEGELIVGRNWAEVESTNEENYNPMHKFPCSNLE